MRKAVQFGAGNIGRGFLGQLLFEGGYQITFVDADAALVTALNARGRYPLRLVGTTGTQEITIENLCVLHTSELDAIIKAVGEADLISTAVGTGALPRVAPVLAAGLTNRAAVGRGPVNVLLCENQWHVGALMRGLVQAYVPPEAQSYLNSQVGLVETVIGRMVPTPTDAVRAEDPLLIVAEPYQELPIARTGLRGPAPRLPGLIMAENFEAYEARKLLLHNMSHAALAYFGYQHRYEFIWQCVADTQIAEICVAAMAEMQLTLAAEYSFGPSSLSVFAEDLMKRFANQALGDTVARVASDPLRKLRPEDRLVGAAALCLKHGIQPLAIAQVIQAALCYDNPADHVSVQLQAMRRTQGDGSVLESVCGLTCDSVLAHLIHKHLEKGTANELKPETKI